MQKHDHWTFTPKALICYSHTVVCSDVCLLLLCLHTGLVITLYKASVPFPMQTVRLASHKVSNARLTTQRYTDSNSCQRRLQDQSEQGVKFVWDHQVEFEMQWSILIRRARQARA